MTVPGVASETHLARALSSPPPWSSPPFSRDRLFYLHLSLPLLHFSCPSSHKYDSNYVQIIVAEWNKLVTYL